MNSNVLTWLFIIMHHQQAVEFRVDHIESCVTPRRMRCICDLTPKMSSFPSSSIVGHGRDSRMVPLGNLIYRCGIVSKTRFPGGSQVFVCTLTAHFTYPNYATETQDPIWHKKFNSENLWADLT